ncbi:hypothetical protein HDV05_008467 [Chytridiales sp. JEL 0842]|nr:hypothetical protein HDV05_008467 [Chytridiales sp. JEL 0842]
MSMFGAPGGLLSDDEEDEEDYVFEKSGDAGNLLEGETPPRGFEAGTLGKVGGIGGRGALFAEWLSGVEKADEGLRDVDADGLAQSVDFGEEIPQSYDANTRVGNNGQILALNSSSRSDHSTSQRLPPSPPARPLSLEVSAVDGTQDQRGLSLMKQKAGDTIMDPDVLDLSGDFGVPVGMQQLMDVNVGEEKVDLNADLFMAPAPAAESPVMTDSDTNREDERTSPHPPSLFAGVQASAIATVANAQLTDISSESLAEFQQLSQSTSAMDLPTLGLRSGKWSASKLPSHIIERIVTHLIQTLRQESASLTAAPKALMTNQSSVAQLTPPETPPNEPALRHLPNGTLDMEYIVASSQPDLQKSASSSSLFGSSGKHIHPDVLKCLYINRCWSRGAARAIYKRPPISSFATFQSLLTTVLEPASTLPYAAYVKELLLSPELMHDLYLGDIDVILQLFPNLNSFYIRSSPSASNVLIQSLSDHSQRLESLSLRGCPVTDALIPTLVQSCKGLKKVDLSYTRVTLGCMLHFIDGCERLTSLSMEAAFPASSMASGLTARGRSEKGNVQSGSSVQLNSAWDPHAHHRTTNLRVLNLKNSGVTDPYLRYAALRCPDLSVLNLEGCAALTDDSLICVASSCADLKQVDLSFCPRITDLSLLAMAMHTPQLQILSVSGCERVSTEGVQALVEKCGKLEELSMHGCMAILKSYVRGFADAKYELDCCVRGVGLRLLAAYRGARPARIGMDMSDGSEPVEDRKSVGDAGADVLPVTKEYVSMSTQTVELPAEKESGAELTKKESETAMDEHSSKRSSVLGGSASAEALLLKFAEAVAAGTWAPPGMPPAPAVTAVPPPWATAYPPPWGPAWPGYAYPAPPPHHPNAPHSTAFPSSSSPPAERQSTSQDPSRLKRVSSVSSVTSNSPSESRLPGSNLRHSITADSTGGSPPPTSPTAKRRSGLPMPSRVSYGGGTSSTPSKLPSSSSGSRLSISSSAPSLAVKPSRLSLLTSSRVVNGPSASSPSLQDSSSSVASSSSSSSYKPRQFKKFNNDEFGSLKRPPPKPSSSSASSVTTRPTSTSGTTTSSSSSLTPRKSASTSRLSTPATSTKSYATPTRSSTLKASPTKKSTPHPTTTSYRRATSPTPETLEAFAATLPNHGAAFRRVSSNSTLSKTPSRTRTSSAHPLEPSRSDVGWITGGTVTPPLVASSSSSSASTSGVDAGGSNSSLKESTGVGAGKQRLSMGSGLKMPTPIKNGKIVQR